MIVGFQAQGTPGRTLVDGASHIRLWGKEVEVAATVHTIGGLSAHADQRGLPDWYGAFENRPPVALVHGEPASMDALAGKIVETFGTTVTRPEYAQAIAL